MGCQFRTSRAVLEKPATYPFGVGRECLIARATWAFCSSAPSRIPTQLHHSLASCHRSRPEASSLSTSLLVADLGRPPSLLHGQTLAAPLFPSQVPLSFYFLGSRASPVASSSGFAPLSSFSLNIRRPA